MWAKVYISNILPKFERIMDFMLIIGTFWDPITEVTAKIAQTSSLSSIDYLERTKAIFAITDPNLGFKIEYFMKAAYKRKESF